jgi:putative PIN family toxin of toxin-antitoxin system
MTNENSSSPRLQTPVIIESPKSSVYPLGTKFPKLAKKESKIKIVPDTNVYLSAIIFGGNPRKVLKLVRDRKIIAYTSTSILLEVAEKLNQKFHWNEEKVSMTIKVLSKITEVIIPTIELNVVKKDPDDNKIIECALKAEAKYIISGDKHLLEIKEFQGINILTPGDFLGLIKV